MQLKEIQLSPFGGARDMQVIFAPGLNVVLGANEAGKSTLVNAAFAALFLISNTRRGSKDWKDYLSKYMPYPHGDTAQVSLAFSAFGSGDYRLTRSFGEDRRAQLTLPDGSIINNENKVQEELQKVLGYGRGTYEGLLFARQDEMEETVKSLSENREAISTLGDVLRGLVLRTGGVSVDELAVALDDEEKLLLARWDEGREGPQNSRGIDNPYEKGCGQVLLAYYEKEKLKRQAEVLAALEKQHQASTRDLKAALREKEQEVDPQRIQMEAVERDIRQRAILEPQLERLAEKEQDLKKVNLSWPKSEERLQNLEQQQENQLRRRKEILAEQAEAQKVLARRGKRDLYQRVKPLMAEADAARKELASLPSINNTVVKLIEEYQSKGLRIKATIEAMKLKVRMTSRHPFQMAVTSGLGQREALHVDGEASFQAAGRLLLEGDEWTLEIQSGQQDVDALMETAREIRDLYRNKLKELGVANLKEARETAAARERLASKVRELHGKVELLLGGAAFSELEAEAARLPADQPVRDPAATANELAAVDMEYGRSSEEIKTLERQLQEWQEKYGQYEQVMDVLADLLRQKRENQQVLEKLAPLPAGYKTPADFIESLEEARARSRTLEDNIYTLKLKVSEEKNNLPEETSEELLERYQLRHREFVILREKARALQVLQEEFREITTEIQKQTFDPLVRSFSNYLPRLTNNRYTGAAMEGAIPGSITSAGGKELPLELLSTGTAGGLALALRLAVSEYLLQDMEGFLVMDDPLVNLDPVRKEQAAAVLKEFAAGRQLIITTCDPVTAALLGGNPVELQM